MLQSSEDLTLNVPAEVSDGFLFCSICLLFFFLSYPQIGVVDVLAELMQLNRANRSSVAMVMMTANWLADERTKEVSSFFSSMGLPAKRKVSIFLPLFLY